MSRRIYISCAFDERDLPEVRSLCSFLQASGCIIEFAPHQSGGWNYRKVEDVIDRCDAFVAVIGKGHNYSTWLCHELYYAYTLNRVRFSPRPRLLGIKIARWEQPNATRHISLEWLNGDEETGQLLLENLPERF